jgi:hypothetical protein
MCKEKVTVKRPALCNYEVKIPLPIGGKVLKESYSITPPWGPRISIPTPNFKNLMKIVNTANGLVNDAIDELEKVNNELGPLKIAFDAAQASLDELEKASDYPSLVAKWILDKATGVVDVKSAEFEGNLSSLSRSNVTMKCNVEFIEKKFNVELPFSFSDPSSMAKKMAKMLLQKEASSGWGETFGPGFKSSPRMVSSEKK